MVVGRTPKPQEGVGPRPGRLAGRVNCRGAPPCGGAPQLSGCPWVLETSVKPAEGGEGWKERSEAHGEELEPWSGATDLTRRWISKARAQQGPAEVSRPVFAADPTTAV